MLIADLDFYLCQASTSQGPPVRSLLVRLQSDKGIEGWGESTGVWRSSELVPRRDVVLPLLADRNLFDLEELLLLDVLASAPLRSAVEMACWDIMGKAVKQPLFRLWGGLFRHRIPVMARLAQDSPESAARLARELVEQGYRTLVVTAAGQPQLDASVLRAVRESAGRRTLIWLDGQRRFDRESALTLCANVEPLGLQGVIDPLAAGDFIRHQELETATSVRLAVSQLIAGPADVLALARVARMPQAVVNLDRLGGLTAVRKCVACAEAANVPIALGGAARLGIATAAALHLAAAMPHLSTAQEFGCHVLQDDVTVERLLSSDGLLSVPQSPGLGIEVDRDKVDELAARD